MDCRKVCYRNKNCAKHAASECSRKYGCKLSIYRCRDCDAWHITRNKMNYLERERIQRSKLE